MRDRKGFEPKRPISSTVFDFSVEKRSFDRHDTSFFVSTEKNPINLQICRGNVSNNGFFINHFKPTNKAHLHPGNELDLVFRLPGAGVWLQSTGLILFLTQHDQSFEIRGKLIRHEPIDLSILESWFDSSRMKK